MDAPLPSYEAAMRDSREYLRRRDLSSQDEIPLYFAWQRLYAAANANLSTDFIQETRAELRARQQARLAPRRGVPPPLFTSFDKVNRTSAQASAFLRSGSSSEAAIEMMARRYRREAEKLRSSRDTLVGSFDNAEKRKKKPKRRQKSPVQEVEELLEAFERPRTKIKPAKSSDQEVNPTKTTTTLKNASQRELDGDEDEFENAEVLPESKVIASTTKSEFGYTEDKDVFLSELGGERDTRKAAELRRSSFSGQNPAAISSFSTVANVAEFAAQVADWRMPENVDGKISSSKTPQKKASSVRKNSLGGSNELRGSTLVEAEMDTTFEGSSLDDGASEEEEGFNETPASPTNRRQTKRGEANDTSDVGEENAVESGDSGKERMKGKLSSSPKADLSSVKPPRVLSSSSRDKASAFQQKLIQLSHAVGDMQVKIKGKQIEVSFKGSLNDEEDVGEVDKVSESPTHSEETKTPSVLKKVLDTAQHRSHDTECSEVEQAPAQARLPVKGLNGPRKQSNVRFADTPQSDGNDDDDREILEPQAASIAPAQEEGGSERDNSARRGSLSEHSVAEDASGEETIDRNHLEQRQRSKKQQEIGDEFAHEHNEEGQVDAADFPQPTTSCSTDARNSTRRNKNERLEERRSESVAPLGEQSEFDDGRAGSRSGSRPGTTPSRLASSLLNEAQGYASLSERLDDGEQNDRAPPSQRSQHVKGSERVSQRQSQREDTNGDSSPSDRQVRATKRESRMSRSRKEVGHLEESFDDESGSRGSDSRDFVPKTRDRRHSSRIHTLQAQVDRSPSSSRDERVQYHGRERGQSRNQKEELIDSASGSDEDLSDGPDMPQKRHRNQRQYHSSHRPRGYHDAHEYHGGAGSRRRSSRSVTSRQEKSYSKPRRNLLEFSDESDFTDRSDDERREEQNSDKFHRSNSRTARQSDSYHQNRSPAHSRHESSRRDHYFTPAMDSRRDTKSKREARANRVAGNPRKLPEGIVWPPGMEEECVARLGLDGHHPIAPPGLEHLVTKEQWGEYWTWLHWYSSWQMWYMKNGKKPKHKSVTRKHDEHRRSGTDDSSERYDKEDPRNANWWVDVAPSKHRRDRKS